MFHSFLQPFSQQILHCPLRWDTPVNRSHGLLMEPVDEGRDADDSEVNRKERELVDS